MSTLLPHDGSHICLRVLLQKRSFRIFIANEIICYAWNNVNCHNHGIENHYDCHDNRDTNQLLVLSCLTLPTHLPAVGDGQMFDERRHTLSYFCFFRWKIWTCVRFCSIPVSVKLNGWISVWLDFRCSW